MRTQKSFSSLLIVCAIIVCGVLGERLTRDHSENSYFDWFSSFNAESKRLPVIDSKNLAELRKHIDEDVVVRGYVSRVGQSGSGNRFIDLKDSADLTLFIPESQVKNFSADLPEELFTAGDLISISGRLELYRDKLQIRVLSPDQIEVANDFGIEIIPRVTTEPVAQKSAQSPLKLVLPTPVQLKETGPNSWVSPAGVSYTGTDSEGRSRMAHVLRHASNQPNRPGPHGVFDGGKRYTFAWIDLAWKKIQDEKIRPSIEGSRETYTVNMRQRVGYLGGEAGERRNNPPLNKIFIVMRSGTSEVITAFPK